MQRCRKRQRLYIAYALRHDHLFDLHVPELFSNGGAYNAFRMPRLDVRETDSAFIVEADLPGMTIEDITVEVEGQTLIIGGERKAEHVSDTGNVAHRERMFGKF